MNIHSVAQMLLHANDQTQMAKLIGTLRDFFCLLDKRE